MSTSPYSQDLRTKVINYLNQGNSQQQASQTFSIHKNTINRWWVRYQEEGNYTARKRLGRKSKLELGDIENFVKKHPNINLIQVGKEFSITARHAGRVLKKLGFRYKKKLQLYGSRWPKAS
jgi:transposase